MHTKNAQDNVSSDTMHEQQLRLLIIDDDEDAIWQINHFLTDSMISWDIDFISDIDEHLNQKLEQKSYDILLLDHKMGSLDGTDLLSMNHSARQKPVVVLTAYDDPELVRYYLENGAISYLVKSELTAGHLERSLIYAYRNWTNKKILSDLNETIALSERLQTANMMAQGIAHELNNGLAIISGNVDLLERHVAQDQKQYGYLKPIQATLDRLSKLTKRVSSIFRDRTAVYKVINLNDYLPNYYSIFKLQNKPLTVNIVNSDIPPQIYADEHLLQVILDEVNKNAVEAMWARDKKQIDVSLSCTEDAVNINILDVGTGLNTDADDAVRPFKTTKGAFSDGRDNMLQKNAHGLGLTLAQNLLYDLGGSLQLANRSGPGCCVNITLPLHRNA